MENSGVPETWQEAFEKQTIPNVKILEKQLRSNISRGKEKLRVLVGGNYRELLSTADEIVALNGRSQSTEARIAELSLQCKPPEYATTEKDASLSAKSAAQLKLVSRCILCAVGALRSKSLLLSAELTVISRLLLKALATAGTATRATEQLRLQDAAVRQQLLQRINAQLVHPTSSMKLIIECIGAHCLITSSSSTDAIKHFQDLRLARLQYRFEDDESATHHHVESFRYLILSIRTLRSLLSRGVNEMLNGLQRQPILENPAISQLAILAIDQSRNLIPPDVLTFTPYIKKVVLQKDMADEIVQTWAVEAGSGVYTGLTRVLQSIRSVKQVLNLRKDLLSALLPVYFSTYPQAGLLNIIRQTTNRKVLQLCQTKIEALLQIGRDMTAHSTKANKSPNLWEPAFVQTMVSSDSSTFLRRVQQRHLGVKGHLDKELKRLRVWNKTFMQLQTQVEAVESIRWQDLIEEPDEDDEELASTVIGQLSSHDTESYKVSIKTTLETTIRALETQFREEIDAATSTTTTPSIPQTIFLIRALREVTTIIRQATPEEITAKIQTEEMYQKLHQTLADEVVNRLSTKFHPKTSHPAAGSISSMTQMAAAAAAAAEDLPSPLTFSVLRELNLIMTDIGDVDIWTRSAISTLTQTLSKQLLDDEAKKSLYTRTEFDELYLRCALSPLSSSSAAAAAGSKGNDAKQETNERIENITTKRAAEAYWNRTKLLFGVLNP